MNDSRRENPDHVELDESNNFFKDISYRYVPYWPIFLFAFFLSIAGAWIYLHYQTPIYEANASILLKDEKNDSEGSNILESLNVSGTKKNVENELVVLKAHSLMRQVVTEMGLYAQIYQKGKVRDILSFPSSPVKFVALYPDSIADVSHPILFEYLPAKNAIKIDNRNYPLNTTVETPYGLFQIFKSGDATNSFVANTKHPFSLQLKSVKTVAKQLSGPFSVSANSKQSTVITLKFSDENPERAEAILNTLINDYSKNGIEDKNTIASHTLQFLEDRLRIVNGELSKVEGDIQQYKSKENIVDISEEGKMFLTSVQESDLKINEISIQLSVLDEVEKYVVKKKAMLPELYRERP